MPIKKRYIILLAIGSYLLFTLSMVPASKVLSLANSITPLPVKVYGVSGNLWNGRAQQVIAPGQPPIDNLHWTVNPLGLLLAKLSTDFNASVKNQNITGQVSVNALGRLQGSDIRARIDGAVMQQLLRLPMGELGGAFNFNVNSVELRQTALPILDASLSWKNARLTLMDTVNLGNIELLITPQDDGQLLASISNKQGDLQLSGDATIDAGKNYTINLRMTPQPDTARNIIQSLGMFARRQADGSYLLSRKGNLREFGF
jgi:hypothetical protein